MFMWFAEMPTFVPATGLFEKYFKLFLKSIIQDTYITKSLIWYSEQNLRKSINSTIKKYSNKSPAILAQQNEMKYVINFFPLRITKKDK